MVLLRHTPDGLLEHLQAAIRPSQQAAPSCQLLLNMLTNMNGQAQCCYLPQPRSSPDAALLCAAPGMHMPEKLSRTAALCMAQRRCGALLCKYLMCV